MQRSFGSSKAAASWVERDCPESPFTIDLRMASGRDGLEQASVETPPLRSIRKLQTSSCSLSNRTRTKQTPPEIILEWDWCRNLEDLLMLVERVH